MNARARTAAGGEAAAPPRPAVKAFPFRSVTVNARRSPDPTKTLGIRRRFELEIRRRFRRLAALIEREVAELDGFALEPEGLKAQRARFDFPRSQDKVRAFMRWLREAERAEILSIAEGVPLESAARTAWTSVYIETAYQRGIADAGAKLRAGGAEVGDTWVSGAFNRPVHADRVGQIFTRVFSELEGVTEAMDKAMSKVLAEGLAEGRSPRDIARRLRDRVTRIGETRARVIARTEVVAAHADATLNAFTEAGVEGVEVEAEWNTTGDARVCPLCRELEGRVFSLAEARNMLPRHPNCRCAWLPKVLGASGVVLNWRLIGGRPRATVHAHGERGRSNPHGNVPRPAAHGGSGGARGGGRPERRAAHGGGARQVR